MLTIPRIFAVCLTLLILAGCGTGTQGSKALPSSSGQGGGNGTRVSEIPLSPIAQSSIFSDIPIIVLGKIPGDPNQVQGLLVKWNPGRDKIAIDRQPLFYARWPLAEIYDYPKTWYVGWFWDGHNLLVARTGEPGLFTPGSRINVGFRISYFGNVMTGWENYYDTRFLVTANAGNVFVSKWQSTTTGIFPLGPVPTDPCTDLADGPFCPPQAGGITQFQAIPFPGSDIKASGAFVHPSLILNQNNRPSLFVCGYSGSSFYLGYTELGEKHSTWKTIPFTTCDPSLPGAVAMGGKIYTGTGAIGKVYVLDIKKGKVAPYYSIPIPPGTTPGVNFMGPYLGLWKNILLIAYHFDPVAQDLGDPNAPSSMPPPDRGKAVVLAMQNGKVIASLTLNATKGELISTGGPHSDTMIIRGGLAQSLPTLPSQGKAQHHLTP